MLGFANIFLFFGLIKCLTPTWDYTESSVELESVYTSFATFDNVEMHTLKKGSTTELYINNQCNTTVDFEGIESFFIINNNYYICPIKSFRPNIYKFDKGNLVSLTNYPGFIKDKTNNNDLYNWSFKCFINSYSGIPTITVFFIGQGFVGYYADKGGLNWPDNNKIYDLNDGKIIYASINSQNILYQVFIEGNEIKSGIGKLDIGTDGDYQIVKYNSVQIKKIFDSKGLAINNVLIKENTTSKYEFYLFSYDEDNYQINKSISTDYPIHISTNQTPPTFPLDIGEPFSVIKFQFFEDSNLYYYWIKGKERDKKYWGIGDFLLEKILFNSKDIMTSIGIYQSSLTNFKIMTNDKVFLLCPFELNSNDKSCRLCQGDNILFINSKTKNKCIQKASIDSSFTIINDTYMICKGQYNSTSEICMSCSNSSHYWLSPNNTCNSTCDETLGYSKNEKDKTCTYCLFYQKYVYLNKGKCIDYLNKNENSFVSNQNLNIIEDCHSSCHTCSGSGSDQCTSCESPNYFHLNKKTCEDNCEYGFVKQDSNRTCINCKNYETQKYYYNNTCVDSKKGYYLKNSTNNIIEKCPNNCIECEDANKCTKCDNQFYLYSNGTCSNTCDTSFFIIESGINCSNCKEEGKFRFIENTTICPYVDSPSGTYLSDKNYNIIKKCYKTCSKCEGIANENNNSCTECIIGYKLESNNCIFSCDSSNKWYYDSAIDLKVCLINNENCPNDKSLLIESKRECVSYCPTGTSKNSEGICKPNKEESGGGEESPGGNSGESTKEDEENGKKQEESNTFVFQCTSSVINDLSPISITQSSIKTFLKQKINEYINSLNNSYHVQIIKTKEISFSIYINNECGEKILKLNNLIYSNVTKCINKLINGSFISQPSDVIISQIDISRKNTEITNQTGYILSDKEGNEINISPCKSEKIQISYPLNSSENSELVLSKSHVYSPTKIIDLNNPKDAFYNDFCFPYYDENGRDVVLIDRRNDYFANNSLCEEGCNYYNIDFKSARIQCECEIKETLFDKINSNIPLDDFPTEINFNNIAVVRCYNLVFNWTYLKQNLGCWLTLSFFIIQIPFSIHFLTFGLNAMLAYLNKFEVEKRNKMNNDENHHNTSNPPKNISRIQNEYIEEKSSNKNNQKKLKYTNNNLFSSNENSPSPFINKTNPKMSSLCLSSNNKFISTTRDSQITIPPISLVESKEIIYKSQFEKQEIEFEDDELNELAYEDAIQYDKRCFCVFYCKLLKSKLFLVSIFEDVSEMEPITLKLIIFILDFMVFFVFNAILFDEEYISKRYNYKGNTGFKYLIENEIPKCVYASLASMIIQFLIDYLANSRKRFETVINKEKNNIKYLKRAKEILKSMKIKLFVFFTLNLILLLAFWYYLSAFCAVYQKTQVPWIEGSIITFVFCMLFYSFLYSFVAISRYIGMKCHISCFYTLSTYFT